jgi:predicted metal-binding membrane protein
MESATIRRTPPLPSLVRLGLISMLLILAALAWAVTGDRMSAMDAGPGTDPGALGFFIAVWVVMMAAMMFPSIAPMVVMYARIQANKRERGHEAGGLALFVGGYLVSWTAAGLAAYALFELGRSLFGTTFAWDGAGPFLAGGVVIGAAVYQLTPLKDACLRKCRSPFMFLLTAWRPGRSGALRMGIGHGAWCVGCCWALMAALFALGIMSLGWMALIAAVIAVEKLLPWQALATRGVAVLLLALGIAVAFSASNVPGLTVPGSPQAMRAMESMGMKGANDGGHPNGSMSQGDNAAMGKKSRGMN